MQQTNSGRKLKLTLTIPSELLNWYYWEILIFYLLRHDNIYIYLCNHLPCLSAFSFSFSNEDYSINRQPMPCRLNLSNHKAQSEVWNIAGSSNGSRVRCEDNDSLRQSETSIIRRRTGCHRGEPREKKTEYLNKAWVDLFPKCGFWMSLECDAPGEGKSVAGGLTISLLSSHIPIHGTRLRGECNEGAITYFEWTEPKMCVAIRTLKAWDEVLNIRILKFISWVTHLGELVSNDLIILVAPECASPGPP